MPDVTLPDGKLIQGVPDGMSKMDLFTKLKSNGYPVKDEWLGGNPNPVKNAAAQNLAPIKLPDSKGYTITNYGGGSVPGDETEMEPTPWSDKEQTAASHGTDITSGAPYALRNKLSLLTNPSDTDMANTINAHFGGNVAPMRDPDTGEMSYQDPKTGRRTLVNSQSLGMSAPTAGGALDMAAQTAGGMGAAAGISAIGGEAIAPLAFGVGATAGQAVSDAGKHYVRQWLGLPQQNDELSKSIGDVGQAGLWNMGFSGAGWLLGPGGRVLTKGLGETMSLDTANYLMDQVKLAKDKLGSIYTLLGNRSNEFQAAIPEILPEEAQARLDYRGALKGGGVTNKNWGFGDPIINQESRRVNSNLNVLAQTFQDVTEQYKPATDFPAGQSGDDIADSLKMRRQVAINNQQLQLDMAKSDAKDAAAGLPSMTADQRNQAMTEILQPVAQDRFQAKQKLWGDLRVLAGEDSKTAYAGDALSRISAPANPSGVQIGYGAQFQIDLRNLWSKGLKLLQSGTTANKNDMAYSTFRAIPDEYYVDPDSPEKGLIFDKPQVAGQAPYTSDLWSYIKSVQYGRIGVRQAYRAGEPAPDALDQESFVKLLRENASTQLSKVNPQIANAWEAAENAETEYQRGTKEGILDRALQSSQGKDPVYDQALDALVLNAGRGQSHQGPMLLANIIKNNPEAQTSVKTILGSLAAEYPQTSAGWSKFQEDFEGAIKYILTPQEQDDVKGFQDIYDRVKQANLDLRTINAKWKANSEFGSLPLSPNSLATAALSNSWTPDKFGRLQVAIRTLPKGIGEPLWKEFQSDTTQAFARMSMTNDSMNPGRMKGLINQYGQRLQAVLGQKYVDNVKTIADAASMATGQNVTFDMSQEEPVSIFTKLVRFAFAPQFSSEGRAYTAVLAMRRKAAQRCMYNALNSPEGLQKFIDRTNTLYTRANIGNAAGVLGPTLTNLLNQDTSEDKQ
jgi:hypothetical protein